MATSYTESPVFCLRFYSIPTSTDPTASGWEGSSGVLPATFLFQEEEPRVPTTSKTPHETRAPHRQGMTTVILASWTMPFAVPVTTTLYVTSVGGGGFCVSL